MDTNENTVQEIGSLAEYVQRIVEITRKHPENASQEFFYRGHANKAWKLEPAVYRIDDEGKSHRAVELQMYQEMLRRNPQAFQDCHTTFECLVKMQHYDLSTRLLDLTQSPLVALYFACCEMNECDGEIIILKANKKDIYFQENLPFNTLSDFEFNNDFVNILADIVSQLLNESKFFDFRKSDQIKSELNTFYCDLNHIRNINSTEEIYFELLEAIEKFDQKLSSLAQEEMSNIHKKISSDAQLVYSNFSGLTLSILKEIFTRYDIPLSTRDKNIIDFLVSYSEEIIIYPPLNNERIHRQRGAFICFPQYQYKKRESSFPTECLTIASDKKERILNELKIMGITRSYLFPELDMQAKDINTNVYPKV